MKSLQHLLVPFLYLTISQDVLTMAECPCESDIIFVVEMGSAVHAIELGNIKDYLNRVLQEVSDCHRTALITYSDVANVEYGFDSGSIQEAQAINSIQPHQEDANNMAAGFAEAFRLFDEDPNPTRRGCRNVVLISGDVSDDKEATLREAQHLYVGVIPRLLIVEIIDRISLPQEVCERDQEIECLLDIFNSANDDSRVVCAESLSCCQAPDTAIQDLLDGICNNCADECRCDIQDSILTSCSGERITLGNGEDGSRNVVLQDDDFEIAVSPATSVSPSSVAIRSGADLGDQELAFDDTSLRAGSLDLSNTRHVAFDGLIVDSDEPAPASKIKGKWVYKETSNSIKIVHKVRSRLAAADGGAAGADAGKDAPVVIHSKGAASGLCTI